MAVSPGTLSNQSRDDTVVNAEGRFLTLIQGLESGTPSSDVVGDPFAAVRHVSIDHAAQLKQFIIGYL